jgi:hypothetical protein
MAAFFMNPTNQLNFVISQSCLNLRHINPDLYGKDI